MLYLIQNSPMQTAAAPANVGTTNVIKTMLQVKGLVPFRIVEWGYSFDGAAAATPGKIELIEANVAATVTAFVAADLSPLDAEAVQFNGGDPTANYISVGVAASGYSASAEGSVTATRNLAAPQQGAPTSEFLYQFPLGYRAYVQAGKFARIRMTFPVAVNAYSYMLVEF